MGEGKGQADVLGMYEINRESARGGGRADNSVNLMTSVRMRVGDFARFCHFLDSMTTI